MAVPVETDTCGRWKGVADAATGMGFLDLKFLGDPNLFEEEVAPEAMPVVQEVVVFDAQVA